jgi:hypothetical protein
LIVNLLKSYIQGSQPLQSGDWWGKYDIEGGDAGPINEKYIQASAGGVG